MSTEELTAASTEAEARAAFLSRVGGPALGARTLLDRAAELLPGVVDAASDVETALTELAAHAAIRPVSAAPATAGAWGLDLATGALRRVPVPASGSPVGVAAGLTWVSALESGLAQHCEALLAGRLRAPGTRVPRLSLAGEGHAVPDALLRALRSEDEHVAHDLSGLLSLPACAVALAPRAEPEPERAPGPERDTVVATGATLAEAARTAVERTLSRRRARAAGRPVPQLFPAIGREQESDAPRPLPCAQWSHPLDALHSQGHSPVAVLLDHDAGVSAVLPYLVRIVLSPT
ncbi:hypothetical protein OG429_32505 [Streptomyces sp. NBC_00190]|uniref:hypothetical protein n=1 Tax=unclassified Streptomyces TaxID=2593676 RepID=UPI002E2A1E9B|nr:hypothetical protein [Streptomyces sp. NBC_00190]